MSGLKLQNSMAFQTLYGVLSPKKYNIIMVGIDTLFRHKHNFRDGLVDNIARFVVSNLLNSQRWLHWLTGKEI